MELQVGQQLIEGNGSMTITWNGEIPEGAYPEVYFGKDSDFVNVYALNVANNRNVDIVKIAICYYSPTNYPPMRPWYTNSSFMESGWGPVTSWAFTNVTIAPHSSSVIYNATFISTADRIIFYFADNSTYAENPSYVPFPYSKYPVYNISQILN
ncbi:hypothetical protein [Thermoplasma sp.]|uniref:hypothetical protein n=1 Tax=Thermoplasma sp. TaxID=1973142 RepID=UPI00126F898A|nr:hypothetical protein [Thermoplasma sp.]KAA8921870.1 MAG: hypothetical protein F6Q11_07310 [Thermoplasma sp.]